MNKYRKSIPNVLRFQVFRRDAFRCQYCGNHSGKVVLEVDHIVPASKGGSDNIDNLITACYECNRGKSAELILPFDNSPTTTPIKTSITCLDSFSSEARSSLDDYGFSWKTYPYPFGGTKFVVSIFEGIKRGFNQSALVRLSGIPKGTLVYRLEQLAKFGFLHASFKTLHSGCVFKYWMLTPKGIHWYNSDKELQSEKGWIRVSAPPNDSPPIKEDIHVLFNMSDNNKSSTISPPQSNTSSNGRILYIPPNRPCSNTKFVVGQELIVNIIEAIKLNLNESTIIRLCNGSRGSVQYRLRQLSNDGIIEKYHVNFHSGRLRNYWRLTKRGILWYNKGK